MGGPGQHPPQVYCQYSRSGIPDILVSNSIQIEKKKIDRNFPDFFEPLCLKLPSSIQVRPSLRGPLPELRPRLGSVRPYRALAADISRSACVANLAAAAASRGAPMASEIDASAMASGPSADPHAGASAAPAVPDAGASADQPAAASADSAVPDAGAPAVPAAATARAASGGTTQMPGMGMGLGFGAMGAGAGALAEKARAKASQAAQASAAKLKIHEMQEIIKKNSQAVAEKSGAAKAWEKLEQFQEKLDEAFEKLEEQDGEEDEASAAVTSADGEKDLEGGIRIGPSGSMHDGLTVKYGAEVDSFWITTSRIMLAITYLLVASIASIVIWQFTQMSYQKHVIAWAIGAITVMISVPLALQVLS